MRYKHLSGYIGESSSNATLNSHFYANFWQEYANNPSYVAKPITFPQRVPRHGFFEELIQNELGGFVATFDQTIKQIKDVFINTRDKANCRVAFLNWAKLCLRYGLAKFIVTNTLPLDENTSDLDTKLIAIQAEIENNISCDENLSLKKLINLNDEYYLRGNIPIDKRIRIINYLIVNYYRHKNCLNEYYDITRYVGVQYILLNTMDLNDADDILINSIGCRGLAMVTGLGARDQEKLLAKAESLAREIAKTNMVSQENLYNCLQTLSKWHLQKGDTINSQKCLKEMISIDPLDSTGYCELGMHFFKSANYQNAYLNYQKAIDLGPPGLAMNSYYCGKSLEMLGKTKEAKEYYQGCIALDDQAISPYLELVSIYTSLNKIDYAKEIVKKIKNTPILYEQLEEDEIKQLHKIIA